MPQWAGLGHCQNVWVLISPVRAGAELVFLELWCPQESLTWWGELRFQGRLLEVCDGAQKPAFLTSVPSTLQDSLSLSLSLFFFHSKKTFSCF